MNIASFMLGASQERKNLSSGNEAAFIKADLIFHIEIAHATKNTIMIDLYQAFVQVHRDGWTQANQIPGLSQVPHAFPRKGVVLVMQTAYPPQAFTLEPPRRIIEKGEWQGSAFYRTRQFLSMAKARSLLAIS